MKLDKAIKLIKQFEKLVAEATEEYAISARNKKRLEELDFVIFALESI